VTSPAAPVAQPATSAGRGGQPRLALRSAIAAGMVVPLVRPATWAVALAGFLAGGGIVILAWPVLALPTPTGLQNLLGAPISTLAFGDPSAELVRAAAVIGGLAAVLLAAGLLAGAWAERESIGLVLAGAAEEGYCSPARPAARPPGLARIALLRGLALLPPLAAFALAWPALYDVTYQELILPGDLAVPLPVRVMARLPLALAALAAVWLLSDTAGALSVRRLVLERHGMLRAWALGWADLARRPLRVAAAVALGGIVLLAAVGPALAAAAVALTRAREVLILAAGSPLGILAAALWVGIWLGAVVLAGIGAAVRSALLTMEAMRQA